MGRAEMRVPLSHLEIRVPEELLHVLEAPPPGCCALAASGAARREGSPSEERAAVHYSIT
jgi:hypothetical protein